MNYTLSFFSKLKITIIFIKFSSLLYQMLKYDYNKKKKKLIFVRKIIGDIFFHNYDFGSSEEFYKKPQTKINKQTYLIYN